MLGEEEKKTCKAQEKLLVDGYRREHKVDAAQVTWSRDWQAW